MIKFCIFIIINLIKVLYSKKCYYKYMNILIICRTSLMWVLILVVFLVRIFILELIMVIFFFMKVKVSL